MRTRTGTADPHTQPARTGHPTARPAAEEGTQFRTILNDTRRDLATAYIRDTELAFGEIAYLLGFASAEAFQRAFKRWLGQTPGDYRRAQRRAG